VLDRATAAQDVEVRGHVAHDDVAAELGRCDAIVLPYLASPRMRDLVSVSGALVDALGLGIPVVASRVRALPELVRHGEDGLLVPPGDAAALADALAAIRDDDGLRARLREGAARAAAGLRARDVAGAALAAYRRAAT
jgi:glycosyltransferase involved in cell wall biosynthesis